MKSALFFASVALNNPGKRGARPCALGETPMQEQQQVLSRAGSRRGWLVAAVFVTTLVFACAIYANLALLVTNKANYKYFPPFKAFVNGNSNDHLGAEYYCIAKSLVAGEGYSSPFKDRTGPTAWMPPLLSFLLAGIIWICEGSKDAVMAVVVVLQVYTLVGTGLLVMAVARRSTGRFGALIAAVAFTAVLLSDFRMWFQNTHDYWLILAAMNVLVAWLVFGRPLRGWRTAIGWGFFGGLCAFINPIVAMAWGVLSLPGVARQRAWRQLAVAFAVAGLTISPWVVRNYLVFGRLIPIKSNLAYELYQSQCLQPDGLLRGNTFGSHPYASGGRERQEYIRVGEMAFLDRKNELFWKSVWADPLDFCDRVASRFLGATLWYEPLDRSDGTRRPWVLKINRVLFPLPLLGVLVLIFTSAGRALSRAQWIVIGLYFLYLMPYIAVSYYERYAMPLLGVKVLLIVWGLDRLLSWRAPRAELHDPWQALRAQHGRVAGAPV